MRMLSGWIRGPWLVALLVASMVQPETIAAGGRGGRGGRAPRQAAPRRPQAYKMPRASNAARPNNNNNLNAANARAANNASRAANVRSNTGGVKAATSTGATRSLAASNGLIGSGSTPHSYSYGSGSNSRRYTANGYGHGYRNRSSGRGYGRSQGNNRALVSRLRSVHTSLARLDHDYKGHRVNAMHSISSALRQLSHRSSSLNGNGNGNTNRLMANNGRNGANGAGQANRNGAGQGNRNGANRMSQAQSDSRLNQALRTTQGIHMQMANQSTNSSTRSSARSHVARAISEMHNALTMR